MLIYDSFNEPFYIDFLALSPDPDDETSGEITMMLS